MDQHYFPPLTSLQLSCIFIFFLLTRSSTTASGATVDSHYLACVNKTCGDGQNISFPFYIKDQQQSFCGFPGFELSCNKAGNPILRLPDSDIQYIIHHIFYNNQTLRVSNSAFWDTKSSTSGSGGNHCDVFSLLKNLSLPSDHQFELVGDHKTQVSVLYNCSSGGDNRTLPERLVSKKVDGCWNGDHDSVVAVDEDDPDLGLARENCTELMVEPVEGYGGELAMITRLRRGFMMKWKASDCSVCEKSGGKCGFDNSTFHFKCFCPDRPHAWNCTGRPGHGKKTILGLTLGFGIGVSVLLIVAMSIYIIRRRRKEIYASPNSRYTSSDPYSKSDLEAASAYFGVPIFSYSELAEATNNFNHEKELGDGGFGTVYYGKLRDGREVAVKRLYEHNYRRVEQFMNEIEILTRLRHKNLVSLYGCTSRHSQGLLLVYEFISNGTIADHLHGDRANPCLLTWPIRMNIAIETASALAYLHASDIIHRDVKTNNILLDNNFCVKVADFGLSRLFPTDVTHVSTAPQGTPGYVDPEYHQCYQLTDKSDVYSFGVVLIELISSMPAVDISRHRHEINLANLAINRIQKQAVDELVDPCLGFHSDEEVKRTATSVAELAFLCLQQNKEMRPSMDVVLEELQRIKSGECKPENLTGEDDDEKKELKSMQQPPPSPPRCEESALLKNIMLPPSPISVTENWISNNTTPTVSN
ncbi:hypothetical protein EZV62_018641 [Acer yangbiense]|uniref:non-specific serine/threonine protein kinase n=1 Tax=Acer yangbiense TaxID=1000413 RepID=A0A5C7HKG5_9ROSI|nr:hypothetical protein EZV62_018641 [Acer yangbiense]